MRKIRLLGCHDKAHFIKFVFVLNVYLPLDFLNLVLFVDSCKRFVLFRIDIQTI